jgi:hypothetical protein
LYAVAIVAGFRYPMSWALMFLTKVTPGIGVLWFLARREWRAFLMAIGVTAAIVAISFLLDGTAWGAWLRLLQADLSGAGQGTFQTVGWYVPIPLLPRLVIAAGVVGIAAWSDRRWLMPLAVVLALPVIWLNSLAALAAVVPLWRTSIASSAAHFAAARPVR